MTVKSRAALLVAGACLAAAPAALASGPSNIPFFNGSGGGASSGSSSGSGGSGSSSAPQGGGGGATVGRTCTIGQFDNSVAALPTAAAVETQFAVPIGCPEGSAWHLQYFNVNTGALEYQDFGSTGLFLTGGGNKGFTAGTSGTEVFSSAAFDTPYRVHMEIDDVNRQLIVAQDATVVTPPAS